MLSLALLLQQFKNPLSPHITSRRLLISPSPRSPSVCGSVSYFLYSPACCVSVRENVEARTSPRVPGRPTQVLWVQTEYAQPQWARNYHRLKRGRFSILSNYHNSCSYVSFISQYLRNLFVLKLVTWKFLDYNTLNAISNFHPLVKSSMQIYDEFILFKFVSENLLLQKFFKNSEF